MRIFARVLLIVLALHLPVSAEQTELGEIPFRQALRDMGTDLRLMCVAAHPDDEDGATLAYFRGRYGIKTYAVIATRGEGGQNEIGPELYNELGVIRTKEMAAASEVTGAELRFLDLPEFGFSKSAEETFVVWGREETVRRLVHVIRETRPDVIITNHDTQNGHGHHQAIGIALLEAAEASADPAQFPEQMQEGLGPWQPARVYVRMWEPGPEAVSVDINAFDSHRGETYAEIAADALARHRSQGMQFFIDRYRSGEATAFYRLTREWNVTSEWTSIQDSLFRGVLSRLTGKDLPLPPHLSHEMASPILTGYLAQLAESAPGSPEDLRRLQRGNDAAVQALELRLQAHVADTEVVGGQTVNVRAKLMDFGASEAKEAVLTVKPAPWFPAEVSQPVKVALRDGKTKSVEIPITLGVDAESTLPEDERIFHPHFMEPQLTVTAEVLCQPAKLRVELPLRLDVAPTVSVRFAEERYLARTDAPLHFKITLANHAPGFSEETVMLQAPPELRLSRTQFPVRFEKEGERRVETITVTWAEGAAPGVYEITATARRSTAKTGVHRVLDVQVPEGILVGLIQGYDTTLADTLTRLGVPHDLLKEEHFVPERLNAYSTIIADMRTYLARPDLAANNAALLEYVRRGGTLIVMYQKTMEWKPEYAPYPLRISTNRVTREDAPVTALRSEHPFFSTPNPIARCDWDGWVQERGLYFADRWDDRYTPLLRTQDPGENIPDGSFLVASYGEGTYVYTALVWYRQLRALNPGALRLFANMLAL